MKLTIADAAEMERFGSQLASVSSPAMSIYLQGNLGAGKTTLARGFLRGLGFLEKVKSPTYTLLEPYIINGQSVYHFDLYRLNDPLELESIGWRDYFDGQGICLVEWPEKASDLLGEPDINILIEINALERKLELQASPDKGLKSLADLQKIVLNP